MNDVFDRVDEALDFFRDQAPADEAANQLTPETAARLRATGVMKMLQPKQFGGQATAITDWLEQVVKIGSRNGAAGWVTGVVGVHSWELAQTPIGIQEEIWGGGELSPLGPDTWCASPYAPFGRAKIVDGGVILNGRWPFSSGTDHCNWIMLGGLIPEPENNQGFEQVGMLRFVLPRSDYEIDQDSWNVLGLEGTGSKDIVIKDTFVPWHHIIDTGRYADERVKLGRDDDLYKFPHGLLFAGVINGGTLSLINGVLREYVEYAKSRVDSHGAAAVDSMAQLHTLAEVASDVKASTLSFLDTFHSVQKVATANNGEVPVGLRLEARRDQIRAVHRASDAVDRLFNYGGGASVYRNNAMQRMWRDMHTARNHGGNSADTAYESYAKHTFGLPLPEGLRI